MYVPFHVLFPICISPISIARKSPSRRTRTSLFSFRSPQHPPIIINKVHNFLSSFFLHRRKPLHLSTQPPILLLTASLASSNPLPNSPLICASLTSWCNFNRSFARSSSVSCADVGAGADAGDVVVLGRVDTRARAADGCWSVCLCVSWGFTTEMAWEV